MTNGNAIDVLDHVSTRDEQLLEALSLAKIALRDQEKLNRDIEALLSKIEAMLSKIDRLEEDAKQTRSKIVAMREELQNSELDVEWMSDFDSGFNFGIHSAVVSIDSLLGVQGD